MQVRTTEAPDIHHLRRLLAVWRTMDYVYHHTPMMIPERRRRILERWSHEGVLVARGRGAAREYRWAAAGTEKPERQGNRTWALSNLRAAAKGYRSLEELRAANPGAAAAIEKRGFAGEIFKGATNE